MISYSHCDIEYQVCFPTLVTDCELEEGGQSVELYTEQHCTEVTIYIHPILGNFDKRRRRIVKQIYIAGGENSMRGAAEGGRFRDLCFLVHPQGAHLM